MRDLWKKIITYHEMIDAIRIRRNTDVNVEILKEDLGISRTTADKMCVALTENRDGDPVIARKNRRLTILGNAGYFLGISIGSAHIRLTLLDLEFTPISCARIRDDFGLDALSSSKLGYNIDESNTVSYAYGPLPTGNAAFESIRQIVSQAVSIFLKRASFYYSGGDGTPFPLMGIGFAVTGPVDYDAAIWRSSQQLPALRDITLMDLIGYQNKMLADKLGLFLSIDNNAKASAVSEYQYLVEKHHGRYTEDVALIDIGSGVESAAIISQKLLRGSHNLSGELGHIRMMMDGANGHLSATKTIEECMSTTGNGDSSWTLEKYLQYIPYVLNAVNCILGVDRFILVGHGVTKNADLIPALMAERIKFTVASTLHYCKAEEGRNEPSTAAIGAAMEAYFSMCGYASTSADERRVNLAKDISWNLAKDC